MALLSESSRTQRLLGCPSQRSSPWGYIPVCGMLMTGPQEVDLWRQIGHKLHSQLPTETSMLKLAYGLLEHHLVVPVLLNPVVAHHGFRRSWTPQANRGWNGCRGTTWYTTIAQTPSVFHRVFLPNATSLEQNTKQHSTFIWCYCRIRVPFQYLCIYVAIVILSFLGSPVAHHCVHEYRHFCNKIRSLLQYIFLILFYILHFLGAL